MGEDLLDDHRVFDARDDSHRTAAGRAGLDVDPEHPLEALRLSHRGAVFGQGRFIHVVCCRTLTALTPPGRCHPVELPPLRERPDDLPLLLQHFIEEAAEDLGKPAPNPPEQLLTLLSLHDFPGNVRELRALVFNALAQRRAGPVLSMNSFRSVIRKDVPTQIQGNPVGTMEAPISLAIMGKFPNLKDANTFLVEEAMRRAKNNQCLAATLLGITRQSLNRRLQRMRKK